MKINKHLKTLLRRLLCDHDFHTLYLDSKFHYERGEPVRYWVCECRKCGKIERVESRKAAL